MTFQGFEPIETRELPEEASTLCLYRHKKTGSLVLHMKNDDPNQVFAIGFRTPPIGSTGNCHILEHCVLNGSRKYRTKEPFMDLLKSSLQTFLNAMTYPDKTLYPVASRNSADFANLMDLYLDAVFYPRVLEDRLIFRQEGWRYEIFHPDEPLRYQGVVYNEMKGALSAAEDQVMEQINQSLYEHTLYAQNSGGDPYEIPQLDYDTFCAFHRTYYHPSNARTFLYGAIDEEAAFQRLNGYFSDFEAKTIHSLPQRVPPFTAPKRGVYEYSCAEGTVEKPAAYLSYSWLLGDLDSGKEQLMFQLLPDLLIGSEAAVLKQELLQALSCEDVYTVSQPLQQVGFSIIAKNVAEEKAKRFEEIIEATLQRLVQEGFAQDLLQATLNHAEYALREKGNFPTKGIIFALGALSPWFYERSPFDALAYREDLDAIRSELSHGCFESFVQSHLIDNPHRTILIHRPAPGKNARKDAEQEQALATFKASLSPEALQSLIEENQALRARQDTPDSPEAKATIPSLRREDLPRSLPKVPRTVQNNGEDTWLIHELPTAGIHYLDLVFDISHIGVDEAPYLSLLCELVGMMDTARHSYADYANEELLATGGIQTAPSLFPSADPAGRLQRKIIVSTKFLDLAHLHQGLDLVEEQLLHTDFSDTHRLLEVIRMLQSQYQMGILQNAHRIARDRALSGVSELSYYNQFLNGLEYYRFLKSITPETIEAVQETLQRTYRKLFTQPHRLLHITSEPRYLEAIRSAVEPAMHAYPTSTPSYRAIDFTPAPKREAFIVSADVQYVAQAHRLPQPETLRYGELGVLAAILSNEYLYNEIRAKGGAYGTGIAFHRTGFTSAWSYRDPNLRRTLQVYQGIGEAIRHLNLREDDLQRFIIGAVGSMDEPMTERRKATYDLGNYLSGWTEASFDRILQEALETRLDALHGYADLVETAMSGEALTVIGAGTNIQEASELFDHIERL